MKSIKRILILILVFATALTLFSCFECEHIDEDFDAVCDKCDEQIEGAVPALKLIENGEANFRFVYSKKVAAPVTQALNDVVKDLKGLDIKVEKIADDAQFEDDGVIEVLIGDVTTRGEKYQYDKYTLGKNGYVIKAIDSKIVINAGSDEQLVFAISEFAEKILGITDETTELSTVIMKNEQSIEEIQSDYRVSSLKVAGNDMRGYVIAVDSMNNTHATLAKNLQQYFYENTGYWFKIENLSSAGKSITIKSVAKDAVEGGFKISATAAGELLIECAYDNAIEEAVTSFFSFKIASGGEVSFDEGVLNTKDVSVVYYDDFGAVGNGKTNDFFAMKAAHDYANISGQLVKATDGKTYYIKDTRNEAGKVETITIKTNVDWGKAKFIIDDSEFSTFDGTGVHGEHIFTVVPNTPLQKIDDKTLLANLVSAGFGKSTTKIDLGLGEPVMIVPYNASHNIYRRPGFGSFDGSPMHEVIILDKDGNVDPETKVFYDYSSIDYIEVYSLKDEHITISGGEFTTKASRSDIVQRDEEGNALSCKNGYFLRGIGVRRSNTTIKNVKHYVTGEITLKEQSNGILGATYEGFFSTHYATHVTFEDCVLTGRRCFRKNDVKKANGSAVGSGASGSYDYGVYESNKVVFKNCKQSNFWIKVNMETGEVTAAKEGEAGAIICLSPVKYGNIGSHSPNGFKVYWGLGGSNHSKNMEFRGSQMSRFDAHAGLMNGKIIDTDIVAMAFVGGGDMYIENVRWFGEGSGSEDAIISLRSDYGSPWDGTIKIKNLSAYLDSGMDIALVGHGYRNWYFGYTCVIPNVEIDNLDLYDKATYAPLAAGRKIHLFGTSMKSKTTYHLDEHISEYVSTDADGLPSLAPIYSVEDKNKDGFIDKPDTDADGKWEETDLKIKDIKKELEEAELDYRDGYKINSLENINVVRPPEYMKITGNDGVDANEDGAADGGYVFVVPKTYGYGIKNGGLYGVEEDSEGGFLGCTKFYYGNGENDYYLGTNHVGNNTFSFVEIK